MKILFAIYALHTHDARALETINALSMIGELVVVSIDKDRSEGYKCYSTEKGRNYLEFTKIFKRALMSENPNVVFLHDNYCAPFIRFVKKRKPKAVLLYDSSELYYDKTITSLKTLYAARQQRIEERDLCLVDGVFAANIERALVMHDRYGLSSVPKVFDNIHRIDDSVNVEECDRKYKGILSDKKIVFYCGGINERRRTFELLDAVQRMGDQYFLLIAGSASQQALDKYNAILSKSEIRNSAYIGYITRSEIKYILQKSMISVSLFDFSCANNILCASGKVYESLFEGTPILTSINPPFKRLCDDENIGVSTEDLYNGIKKLEENYEWYKSNVDRFRKTIDYDHRVIKYRNDIESFINQSLKR